MSLENVIVQSVQTSQTGQHMQGTPIMLGFVSDNRGFIISITDGEQKYEGGDTATETASIIVNPLMTPLFNRVFTEMAEGTALPLNMGLNLCVKEGHISGTALEKLEEYREYLKTRRKGDKRGDKAEKTVNGYCFDVKGVLKEIARKYFGGTDLSELELSAITSNHILEAERFIFKESGKAPSTLSRLTVGWNSFCDFLGMGGWKFIPQENVGREYRKDVVSNDEVLRMLEYIRSQIEEAESFVVRIRLKRQEIAILLGWDQGLRSCEYVNVKFDDAEHHDKIVIKNSKHNGTREVALTSEARTAILELKDILLESGLYPTNGGVFEKPNGKCYSTSTFRRWLKKVAAVCGVEHGRAKTHGLRHRFAKNFNNTKGDIFMLADIMGHRSTETTRKYSEATFEDQRTALQHVSDVARNEKLAQAS